MTLFNVATCLPHIHTPILRLLKLALLSFIYFTFSRALMNFLDTVLFLFTMFVVYYLIVSHENVGSTGQESLTLLSFSLMYWSLPRVVLGSLDAQLIVDK